jgi:hypothetical protein
MQLLLTPSVLKTRQRFIVPITHSSIIQEDGLHVCVCDSHAWCLTSEGAEVETTIYVFFCISIYKGINRQDIIYVTSLLLNYDQNFLNVTKLVSETKARSFSFRIGGIFTLNLDVPMFGVIFVLCFSLSISNSYSVCAFFFFETNSAWYGGQWSDFKKGQRWNN